MEERLNLENFSEFIATATDEDKKEFSFIVNPKGDLGTLVADLLESLGWEVQRSTIVNTNDIYRVRRNLNNDDWMADECS